MEQDMNEGGKGDKQRPLGIDKEEFDKRWDDIFNKEVVKEKDGGLTLNVNVENQDYQATITYKVNI
jgi:hypothetical protein